MREAVVHDNTEEVTALLKNDPNLVNAEVPLVVIGAVPKTKPFSTPLNLAVGKRDKKMIEFLLGHGADVNAKDSDNATPLHHAVGERNLVDLLLAHAADVNAKDSGSQTPLHLAAALAEKDSVELLLAHGADVNAVDASNHTPLYSALHISGRVVLRWVLSGRAGTGLLTPEMLARAQELARGDVGRQQVAEILRQHGGHE
jgi:ankyrin repeat protein